MRLDSAYTPITVDEFLAMDFGTDRRFELVNGVIQMMTGGSSVHSRVAGNIYLFLRLKLRGTPCQPYNSDMGVRVDANTVRYPDVTVFCDKPWDFDKDAALAFSNPRVIFEVLSPSTSTLDQGTKLEEYRWLPSVDTIVFVDPVNELTRTFQRQQGGTDSWIDSTFARPHDVDLPALRLTIAAAEIFRRD